MSSGRSCGESPARSSTGWAPSARTWRCESTSRRSTCTGSSTRAGPTTRTRRSTSRHGGWATARHPQTTQPPSASAPTSASL